MRAEETVVTDADAPIKIGSGILGSGNTHPAVVGYEIHFMTDRDAVADGDQVRLAAEGKKVSAKYLDTFSYLGALAAEVPHGIPAKSESTCPKLQDLADHRYFPARLGITGILILSTVTGV